MEQVEKSVDLIKVSLVRSMFVVSCLLLELLLLLTNVTFRLVILLLLCSKIIMKYFFQSSVAQRLLLGFHSSSLGSFIGHDSIRGAFAPTETRKQKRPLINRF